MLVPVNIVQAGDDHALAGRSVQEFAFFDIYSDVAELGAGLKEDQIAWPKLASFDPGTQF